MAGADIKANVFSRFAKIHQANKRCLRPKIKVCRRRRKRSSLCYAKNGAMRYRPQRRCSPYCRGDHRSPAFVSPFCLLPFLLASLFPPAPANKIMKVFLGRVRGTLFVHKEGSPLKNNCFRSLMRLCCLRTSPRAYPRRIWRSDRSSR